jgi:hypothetical protein
LPPPAANSTISHSKVRFHHSYLDFALNSKISRDSAERPAREQREPRHTPQFLQRGPTAQRIDVEEEFEPAPARITGRPSRLSSVHNQVVVGPVSRPIRTVPDAFDFTNAAIALGSESTTPSSTIDPAWFTTQIDVCFNDTSSPI